ncbi:MAG TPA: helix-turn-helix domain-containing protein [Rhodopila sp.]|nr:helix-turn-helix domain-containing protein [Rhodopila sp.]
MTPFGARLRSLRARHGITLKELAEGLQVSAAYLSALEHGRRGAPSSGLVHQVNEYFGLIWDEAEELSRLARLSHPRVTVNTAGLSAEQTALANRLAQMIHRLPPETVAALHGVLDAASEQAKPRLRRAAGSGRTGRRAGG